MTPMIVAAVAALLSASQPKLNAMRSVSTKSLVAVEERGDGAGGVELVAVAVADDAAVRLPAVFDLAAGLLANRRDCRGRVGGLR